MLSGCAGWRENACGNFKDFVKAMNKDVAIWKALIAKVGELEALAVVKQRLAARDPKNLINWRPSGLTH